MTHMRALVLQRGGKMKRFGAGRWAAVLGLFVLGVACGIGFTSGSGDDGPVGPQPISERMGLVGSPTVKLTTAEVGGTISAAMGGSARVRLGKAERKHTAQRLKKLRQATKLRSTSGEGVATLWVIEEQI